MKLSYMKSSYLIFLMFWLTGTMTPQVVVTVPEFATENDSIKIIFDATQGDQGLMGYTGDVWAHTGVITNFSTQPSDWKHVIGNWGNNDVQPKLTRIATDLYELVIGFPRQFYNVTDPNEKIEKLAFVFRNHNGTVTGRDVGGADIFADLFEPGLSVVVVSPTVNLQFGDPRRAPVFAGQADTVQIAIKAAAIGVTLSALSLVVNGVQLAQSSDDSLNYEFVAAEFPLGFNQLQAIATASGGAADTSSFEILVQSPPLDTAPPPGIQPGITYNDDDHSVTLALFAPYKQFVYVIGDFSDWKVSPALYMKRHAPNPDSTLWWLTIEGLNPGQEYAFQYLVDGNLRIADPYTEKVLDPWNDPFIPAVTYPNLKPYPAGKTAEPVAVLQTAQAPFTWQYSDSFQRPAKEDLVIYELLVRDFIARHDFQTLQDTLDYLENLGINAIELMPFNEFEGNSSWGYNSSFHFAPDKYYGTEEALKSFIDECHRRGIAVIMDIVLNHAYGQSPLVRLYWNSQLHRPAANNPWFNEVSPNPVFSFGFDFNHESPHTRAYVDRTNLYWLQEYKIDGFRFDFTKGFTNTPGDGSAFDAARIAILQRMADVIWTYDSTAYVILEHFGPNNEEKILAEYGQGMMLWGNLNYNYNEATMGYHDFQGGQIKSDFSWGYYGTRGWSVPNLVTYMESHDEERLMYKNLQFGNQSPDGSYRIKDRVIALNRIKLAAAFFLTYPGPKMIWQFGELGYDISIDNPCRVCEKPILWQYFSDVDRRRLYDTYRALLKLRRENPVFRSPETTVELALSNPTGIKRITLAHPTMNVSIVGNFGVTANVISGDFAHPGTWYDYFSGDSIQVVNSGQVIPLAPGEFHIFTDVKLEAPEDDLLTAIAPMETAPLPAAFSLRQNYPNPFNPETTVEFSVPRLARVHLVVYNLLGQPVKTLANEDFAPGQYRLKWDGRNEMGEPVTSGIYLLRMYTEGFSTTRRIVLMR